MKHFLLSACSMVALSLPASAQMAGGASFIPQPQFYQTFSGKGHTITAATIIAYTDGYEQAAELLAQQLLPYLGKAPATKEVKNERQITRGMIFISSESNVKPFTERYTLDSSDGRAIKILGDYHGVINGISTLMQSLSLHRTNSSAVSVPAMLVHDLPKNSWRGLMLDCSRHFYSVAEVKELLDVMARYKLNKFHWHLTDDQGWRIEIKRYPLLTERGAWRTFNNHDKRCLQRAEEEDNPQLLVPADKCRTNAQGEKEYGGFYTQSDIVDIVNYAAQRGIDVIPEIDMPGHMLAGVSNYEGISCFTETGWGSSFSSPICPGKDSALEFCRNVYDEILQLFPYEYVHIGGDEVEKTNWKKCPDCQARIKSEGLADEEQLQAWFVTQMEQFFNSRGKKMIAWDETSSSLYHAMLDGNTEQLKSNAALSTDATVMWWRGWNEEVPPLVTRHGNDIIYTPNSILYLDNEQDQFSVDNILKFNPLISHGETGTMTPVEGQRILGYQGNVWCEQIPSRERMFYQVMPRLFALSEKAWGADSKLMEVDSPERETEGWDEARIADFHRRMMPHFDYLKTHHIPYHLPELKGMYNVNAFLAETDLSVTCADPTSRIYYSTDGSFTIDKMQPLPSAVTTLPDGTLQLVGKLHVAESMDVTFRQVTSDGTPTEIIRTRFQKDNYTDALPLGHFAADGTFAPSNDVKASQLTPGLHTVWHEFPGGDCRLIAEAPVNAEYECENVCIPVGVKGNIGLITTGYMNLPTDGIYTFALFCDDGSDLVVDNLMVVDNNREQYPRELICQKALRKGIHPMTLRYFDHNGGLLRLRVFDPDGREMDPAKLYLH